MTSPGDCLQGLRKFFSGDGRVLEWGIAPARPTPKSDLLQSWVQQGRHAGMRYMEARLRERMDPQTFHPWAESVVMFSFPYASPLAPATESDNGYRVAAYARGDDYHDDARTLLKTAEAFLREELKSPDLKFYGFVDTAPVFERDLASEAGLGWRGKNCCTLSRTYGSAFHLAGFFLDIPLSASQPVEDFCGGCTRCIDQCPTEAFTGPGQLDANKCISYWTIEAKGEIPEELGDRFGGWIFGCDICQQVCPWNHKHVRGGAKAEGTGDEEKQPAERFDAFPMDGPAWLALLKKGGGFQSRFKHSPLTRAGRKALLRNVAVAARNLGDRTTLESFRELLSEETEEVTKKEIERTIRFLESTTAG